MFRPSHADWGSGEEIVQSPQWWLVGENWNSQRQNSLIQLYGICTFSFQQSYYKVVPMEWYHF